MSGTVDSEAPRPRPLSGGLWTLFSWLRRDEQRSSSESLSSTGSDRTVASFAFLTPAHYQSAAAPIILPPPGPPTDSYKKRVHERNLRRQHDRDLTLHRKYGLYRGELGSSYDAFTLPCARRFDNSDRQDRDRRATSESLQLRTAYVPGKRRAPLPPNITPIGASSSSLTQRHSRKRRAPPPPVKLSDKSKHFEISKIKTTHMNNTPDRNKNELTNDTTLGCKSEKYIKKEKQSNRENKPKVEKSFIKQIFENKKRNSAIESSSVKILPSISELDKQAAELIENSKQQGRSNLILKKYENNTTQDMVTDVNIRKNNGIVILKQNNKNESIYTQTENQLLNITSPKKTPELDERKKLKVLLKEMKDSLPKKTKPDNTELRKSEDSIQVIPVLTKEKDSVTETPTLRIGSPNLQKLKNASLRESTSEKQELRTTNDICFVKNNKKITDVEEASIFKNKSKPSDFITKLTGVQGSSETKNDNSNSRLQVNTENNKGKSRNSLDVSNAHIHTPLKISSLLNPVYIPKDSAFEKPQRISSHFSNDITDTQAEGPKKILKNINVTTGYKSIFDADIKSLPSTSAFDSENNIKALQRKTLHDEHIDKKLKNKTSAEPKNLNKSTTSTESQTCSSNSQKAKATKIDEINQHARRRDLINQLEQSIAKGDERSAAEAATKLAQLRLSCSVLSFSSQILGESSKNSKQEEKQTVKETKKDSTTKSQEVTCEIPKNCISHIKVKINDNLSVKTNEVSKTAKLLTNKTSSESAVQTQVHIPSTSHEQASPSRPTTEDIENLALISVWVEDKEAARGPVRMRVQRLARLGELRREAEFSLGIEARLQRWIVGRTLCTDDNIPLVALAGPDLRAPFYLCLVESETKTKSDAAVKGQKNILSHVNANENSGVYTELVQLERQALVSNTEMFECEVCMERCPAGQGAVLRECVHSFCRECLADMIRHCEEPVVTCPAMGCPGVLHEREIRALVTTEEYEHWLARGLASAESSSRNAFHCRTRDCTGWALCEPGVRKFPCPVCKCSNCVPCQAIHENETCDEYRANLQRAANTEPNHTDEGTRALLDALISRGEALVCPECNAIITKKWGCDWIKCSACKTEICWVTRGRRWGPSGRGDTSGGCRCGVDGKRCHPSCGYCH